jgi:hypothetical protein
MSKSKRVKDDYERKYPDEQPWSKKIYFLQEGQTLKRGTEWYIIKQVIRSKLVEEPRVVAEQLLIKEEGDREEDGNTNNR